MNIDTTIRIDAEDKPGALLHNHGAVTIACSGFSNGFGYICFDSMATARKWLEAAGKAIDGKLEEAREARKGA